MAAATIATQAGILTTIFTKKDIARIAYESPFLGMVKKDTGLTGLDFAVSVRTSAHTGGSADFATARANANPNQYTKFRFDTADDYALGYIHEKAIRAAKAGGKGVLVDGLKEECQGLAYSIGFFLANALYGNGGGSLAKVKSGQGTKTITLENAADAMKFTRGMRLDGSATDGTSGSVIAGGVEAVIESVDYDAGTITKAGAANWNSASGINGLAAGGFLFRENDFGKKLKGLSAWLPSAVPSVGDSFGGVDRSRDSRLCGIRVTAEATIRETILKASARVFGQSGRLDTVLMHPEDVQLLINSLGSQVVYNQRFDDSKISAGYTTVKLFGQGGPMDVIPDPHCPRGVAFGLQLDTWTLYSLGDCPGYLNEDGVGKLLREPDAPTVGIRMGYFAQLACDAPWKNARITLPVAT